MNVPNSVAEASRLASDFGFENSCLPETGRLLRVLVAHAGRGNIGEIGTACGVGTAWMSNGLQSGQRFFSVESNGWMHDAVSESLEGESARLILGDWRKLLEHAPFRLLFVDVTEAKDDGVEEVIDALEIGGMAVLDDFTPPDKWPKKWRGKPDFRRKRWLENERLAAAEVATTGDSSVILATRIS